MADKPREPYIGLARRYRPQTFSDLVGQDQIAHSLTQQVSQGKVAQAYIFSGPRGTGKTSSARILAKSLNCLSSGEPTPTPCGTCDQCRSIAAGSSLDVIEIDGASNNSVEDIRNLQETINQNPFSARKKIYIIDEVHMLSQGAFNALLKTLEEPPDFVVFIFATTEFERIPETIKSRCQPFRFDRISVDDIVRRLEYVSDREGIEIDPGERRAVLETIAYAVDGGMRDALMTLDQLAALSDDSVRLDETARFLGMVEHDMLLRTVEMLADRDTPGLIALVAELVERGRDLERFIRNLLGFLRDLMILKSGGDEKLVSLSGEKLQRARDLLWRKDEETGETVEVLAYASLLNFIHVFMRLESDIRESVQVRIHLEFAFVKLTALEPVLDIDSVIQGLSRSGGGAPRKSTGGDGAKASASRPAAEKPSRDESPSTPDLFGGSARKSDSPSDEPVAPEPVRDDDLWQAVLEQANGTLSHQLELALRDCQFRGVENDRVLLDLGKRSLSMPRLQDRAQVEQIESLVSRVAGRNLRIRVRGVEGPRRKPGATESGRAPRSDRGADDRPAPEPPADLVNSRRAASPARTGNAPVLREERPTPAAPPADFGPTETVSEDTHALYMAQNPSRRGRYALSHDPRFRDKVDQVRRFFDGKVYDLSGDEIPLV